MKTQTIHINNQTFILHPSGVIYWREKDMVLVSDVHLGKVTHFRKHGSAVPQGAIDDNFIQLDAVLEYFNPKTLCFLGDLFHSYLNTEWILFEQWIGKIDAKVVLVAGNHDVISPLKFEELDIHVTNEWLIDEVLLTHHPESRSGFFNFSGHIHPGVQLKGLGKQTLTVPCFFKKKDQLILPAFGTFTGKHTIKPQKEDQVFAITPEEVIPLLFN